MDYFSRYLEIAHLSNIRSEQVIGKLKNIFARWGVPEVLVSDNGTQFTSQNFQLFAKEYNFVQSFSSPHYPQANGEAESAVKIAKHILRQDDVFRALMAYRSTPVAATGVSPSELIMGRRMRTAMPVLSKTLKPKWPNLNTVRNRDKKTKERYRFYYDRHYSTKPLPELEEGEKVLLKLDNENKWTNSGIVKSVDHERRSCIIETPHGTIRRNRRHIQKMKSEITNPDNPTVTMQQETEETELPNNIQFEVPNSVANSPTQDNTTTMRTRSGREVVKPARFKDFV